MSSGYNRLEERRDALTDRMPNNSAHSAGDAKRGDGSALSQRAIFAFGLLALFPIADLAVAITFFDMFGAPSDRVWPALILASLQSLAIWIAILALLYLVISGAAPMPRPLRWIGYAIAEVLVIVVLLQCLFTWMFLILNHYPPSSDVLLFLVLNSAQIPAHIYQSSPSASVMMLGGVVGASFGLLFGIHLLAKSVNTRNSLSPIGLFCGSIAMIAVLSTYVRVPISGIGLISLVSPFGDWRTPAAARDLEMTLVPKSGVSQPLPEASPKVPVIVILVESLRRDLMDLDPTPIPYLRQLAAGGDALLIDKAYATASHSDYADVAFWYSRYPLRSMNRLTYDAADPARGESLFAAMKQYGYTTAYISSQNENWGGMIEWLNNPGEVDYFYHSEDYDGDRWTNEDDFLALEALHASGASTAGKIEDSQTLQIALKWIREQANSKPFFLGMNLQNTHFSYVYPTGAYAPYKPDELNFKAIYYNWPEHQKDRVRNRYLNAVVNVDRLIERFAEALRSAGLWEEALFVLVGDSGEAFYQHGFGNHSGPMYDEVMRTFAVIKPPQGASGPRGTYEVPVSHLDIAATILDYVGVSVPGSFQGESILDGARTAPIYMHTNAMVKQNGIVEWPWKLLDTSYPYRRLELYNLEEDPGERRNVVRERPAISEKLTAALTLWMERQTLYYSDAKYYLKYDPPH